jgi:hypothetical protein
MALPQLEHKEAQQIPANNAATNKRCPNGYRRDKKTGECIKLLIKKPVL